MRATIARHRVRILSAAGQSSISAHKCVTTGDMPLDVIQETVVRLLCMAGLDLKGATELAERPRPPLSKEVPG